MQVPRPLARLLLLRCLLLLRAAAAAGATGGDDTVELIQQRRDEQRTPQLEPRGGAPSEYTKSWPTQQSELAHFSEDNLKRASAIVDRTMFMYMTHIFDRRMTEQASNLNNVFSWGNYRTVHPWERDPGFAEALSTFKVLGDLELSRNVTIDHIDQLNPVCNWQGARVFASAIFDILAEPDYDYVWVMEWDVHFENAEDIKRMVRDHASDDSDLLVAQFWEERERHWPHYEHLLGLFSPHDEKNPFYGMYSPVLRLSRRFVDAIVNFETEHGKFIFFEPLFPTLAMRKGFKVSTMLKEYAQDIRFGPCWDLKEAQRKHREQGGTIFHPLRIAGGVQQCP